MCDKAASPDQAARMFTPGATRSGFMISGTTELGPRDENPATNGARFSSLVAVTHEKPNEATGYGTLDM